MRAAAAAVMTSIDTKMHILEIGADQDDEGFSARLVDPVFRTVSRNHTAFIIWKVTENGMEMLPRSNYGTFYDSEVYLVYSCSLPGQPAGPDVIRREIKENGEYGERHIHAYAGERSGTLVAVALRRASQLASHLGSPTVVHREKGEMVSPRLLSYFRDGIRILLSGHTNGGPRLYRIRGHKPVMIQLESVSWSRLASDGVFLLDTAPLIVLWVGRTANLIEKIHGAKIACRLSRGAEKGARVRHIAIAADGYEQKLSSPERALLDAVLEPAARLVRSTATSLETPRAARLYRTTPPHVPHAPLAVPSQRPAARLEEIKRAPLYREDLADDGVYIVDGGSRGIWAWLGPAVSGVAARGALTAARGLARARQYAGPVSMTSAGREPLEFAALFHRWRWCDAHRDTRLRAARSANTKLDAVSLATNSWLAAEAQLPDDGSGSLRMWRVRHEDELPPNGVDSALVEVERPQQGVFFNRDCYIALYTYHAPTGEQSILYYWMGGSSPNDLRNLGAKEAKDLYIKLQHLPVQAWVYQGKEPAHFLQIFKGRMITYVGSATDYDPSGRRVVAPSRALICVSGQYTREARGTEVQDVREAARHEVRGACYILRETARVWVWCATTATGDEREVAKKMAAADHKLVIQGKETRDFWIALGDLRHLLVTSSLKEMVRPLPPRLFYVSMGPPGHYTFEEAVSFNQYSLTPAMAAVLDAHTSVFVWLGAHGCPRAKDDARAIGQAYLAQDPAVRDPETSILMLNQDREPPNFTGFFPHWKQNMWKDYKTFGAIIDMLKDKAIVQGGDSVVQNGNSATPFDQYEKYPLVLLRGPKEHMPNDVDPLIKELYLTHDDFVSTFKMSYSDFQALPKWKQKEMKKAVGLF